MKSPNKYIFDYPVLDKYKIKPTMMPAESSFINKPKYTMTHVLLGVIGLVLVAGVVFVYKKVI
jgi:translation initiation factor 2 gamma subunit (eIF-2gamma)